MRRAALALALNLPGKLKLSLLLATASASVAFSDEIKSPFLALSRSAYTLFTVSLSLFPIAFLLPFSFFLFFYFFNLNLASFLSLVSFHLLQIASTVIDYKYSLLALSKDSDDYRLAISQVHLRSAKRILKLCKDNKGFYVKAGQFAASLRQLPKEYTVTLSVLQDKAVPCDFRIIKEVICRNFQCEFNEIFTSFDEEPIAAASIGQVHHAVLKSCQEVAVKVQYPGLEKLMKLDITTMSIVSEFVSLLFPEYRFEWILSAFKDAISVELDFIQEARNSERAAENFRHNKNVKIPRVFWDLTTKQVLTMQFCPGFKVDDLEALQKWGIDPRKVAKALVEVFSEMIFIHGFVHGDPHPGNIQVSPNDGKGFTLVLLDHGMYKELDEGFRRDYCRLWKALMLRDANEIQYIGECFGVGRYAKYLPLIFTGKPISSTSGLGKGMSVEEKNIVKQQLKGLAMEDISSFMESLPADFLIVLRTDGILRSTLNKLGVSRSVRLLTYAKHAVYGLSVTHESKSDSTLDALLFQIRSKLSYLQFKCILGVLGLLSWMDDIKYLSSRSLRSLAAATRRLRFSQLSQ